jgi:hypothetical protein
MPRLNPESGWRHGGPRKREQHVGGHRLRHPNLLPAPVPKAPDGQGKGRLKETRSRKEQERTDLGAHGTLSSVVGLIAARLRAPAHAHFVGHPLQGKAFLQT